MENESVDWTRILQVASRTDVGMRRSNNQDNLCVVMAESLQQWAQRGHLFMVADGMGAHAAGDLASQLAADTLSHLYSRGMDKSIGQLLRESIEETNLEIHRRGQANPDYLNMGTTCSAAALTPKGLYIGHVGDSRVYRLRGKKLHQLTFDHSLVWEMRAAGQFKDAPEMESAVRKNVITRSLGPYPEVKVDIEGPFPVQNGDTFLLCSDGLTGPVTDEEIGSIVGSLPPEEAVNVLVDLANLRGGPDNITVVIAKIVGDPNTVSGGSPAQVRSNHEMSVLVPVSWIAFLVFAIISVLMATLIGSTAGAIVPVIGAVAALVAAMFFTIRHISQTTIDEPKGKVGKAPYTQTNCEFSPSLQKDLQNIVEDLVVSGKNANWDPDWKQIELQISTAEAAIATGDHNKAIGTYGRIISGMMSKLRKNRDD